MITVFLDIDGCISKHPRTLDKAMQISIPDILPDVLETIAKIRGIGGLVILTTGRPETMRKITEEQLFSLSICYDQLIMGLSNNVRVVVNDKKHDNTQQSAFAINLNRDTGLGKLRDFIDDYKRNN